MMGPQLGNPGKLKCISSPTSTYSPSSPLIEGAWAGNLLHLSGLDVIGSTAGSLARLVQDREIELWENKRIVAEASPEEVSSNAAW